jgi:hypothetical protein
MKKLLVSILMLLLILTACTTGGTETEETAVPPTEVSLPAAPTATDEPTAEPTATDIPTVTAEPEATDTAEPEPTDTAEPEPTETAEPTATAGPVVENPPNEEAPPVEPLEIPEGAVIAFTLTGGFAGFNDTWAIYSDGRVTKNHEINRQLTPEEVTDLINQLEELDFFDTVYFTKPGTICCDFFDYGLAAQNQDRQNFVSFSDGDENVPSNLRESVNLILNIINAPQ